MSRGRLYELENIVGERVSAGGGRENLAKWLHYPADNEGLTWEPRGNFHREAVEVWERGERDVDGLSDGEGGGDVGVGGAAQSAVFGAGENGEAASGAPPAVRGEAGGGGGEVAAAFARPAAAQEDHATPGTHVGTISPNQRAVANEANPPRSRNPAPPSTSSSELSLPDLATRRAIAAQDLRAPTTTTTDEDAEDYETESELSEYDTSNIDLPADHVVPAGLTLPNAITGESVEGLYRVTWPLPVAGGEQRKPVWVRRQLVRRELVVAWLELKGRVLPLVVAGRDEEGLAGGTRVELEGGVLVIEPLRDDRTLSPGGRAGEGLR
ncbi:hypothetical protein LTR08_002723 [Meristemomyces frigidus]|nr:hypothetical protein LTR08_002723 [Meristemomyces frigidus]